MNTQTVISKIEIDNSKHFNFFHFLFVFAVGSLFFILLALRKKIGQHPEYGFFAIAMICGTLISMSEPKTFISWDDGIHFNHTQNISNSVWPISVRPEKVPFSYSIAEQPRINEYVDSKYKQPKKSASDGKPLYTLLSYTPSAIALAIGGILHLPGHIVFTLGRLANVLVFSVIVFFAIRKLKSGKMMMAVIALFPTSIFLASNYNYDSWVTAFTLLGFAYFFSELQQPEKKMTRKDAIIIVGSFVVGLGPKAIYFPLLLPLFLLKSSKFSTLAQYKKFKWAVALAILFLVSTFFLPFVLEGPGEGDSRGGSDVNAAQQVKFIISEPLAYSQILFNFTKSYINPVNAGGFTTSFAYLNSIGGLYLVLLILGFVAITDKNEFDKKTSNLKMKLLFVGIYFATVALISTALYISFTAVKSPEIAGVQPRYLLPLIFPLLYVLGSDRIRNPFNKILYNTVIFASMAGVILVGVWEAIISRYY